MTKITGNLYAQLVKEKYLNGLRFGLMAGLGYSLALWGLDGLAMAGSSVHLPWMKLVIGLPACLLLGAIAGWLSARFDNGLLSAVFWLVTSICFVWIASHVPFDGVTRFTGLLFPELEGLNLYPFVEVARLRMSLLYVIVGVLMVIGGAFEMFVVETASRTTSAASRWLYLSLAGLIIFGAIGLLVDDLINKPLRQPLVSIHELIEFGKQAQVQPVTQDEVRQRGLRALNPFGDMIYEPYRLILGHYDPETITETSVYIDFNGTWGSCFLIGNTPMYCQLSRDLYEQRLACLMGSGKDLSCRMKLTEQGREELESLKQIVGDQPEIITYTQNGTAVLLDVSAKGAGHHLCFLHATGDIYFEGCEPKGSESITTRASRSVPTKAPVAMDSIPSPFPTQLKPTSEVTSMLGALIPKVRENPPVLSKMTRYAIDLVLNYSTRSYQGSELIDYINVENISLGEVYFRLLPNGAQSYGNGFLKVNQVLLNGQPAETELSQQDTILKVNLPRMLMPGSHVQFEIDFYGLVTEDFGGQETPAGYGIYNISDGVMAMASWYPVLAVYDHNGWNLDVVSPIGDSVYSDTALYSVDITVDANLVVAATGSQVSRQVVNDRARLHYESGPARDFFLITSPDFKFISQTVNDTIVNSYYLPGNLAGAQQALRVATSSLRIFNNYFGLYPFTEMDIVAAPLRNARGVEFPGIMLIGDHLYEAPEKPEFATTVAHEVAHQWWYNVVGNDVFDEPWLDEALATYSSSLYFEFEYGAGQQQGLIDYWQERYDQLLVDGNDDLIIENLAHFERLSNPQIYSSVVYIKGALFFRALRERIGDEVFFAALKKYYSSQFFKIARSGDLLDIFEKTYRQQLDAFYQVWLYSTR